MDLKNKDLNGVSAYFHRVKEGIQGEVALPLFLDIDDVNNLDDEHLAGIIRKFCLATFENRRPNKIPDLIHS